MPFSWQNFGFLVRFQGARKIIERDQASGHVAERCGGAFGIGARQKFLIGTLVACQGLGEAVLAVIDISDVQFKPRDAPAVIAAGKDVPRPVGGSQLPLRNLQAGSAAGWKS